MTAARSPASSSRCASGPPTTPNATRTGCCPSGGCWPSGPTGKDEPVKYWLSNLPPETPLVTLVRLAKLRWRVEHDYRELKQCLGLDHYEGRTYRGLHHHLTFGHRRPRVPHLLPTARSDPAPALKRRQPDQPLPSPARSADRAGVLARPLPGLPAQAAAMTTYRSPTRRREHPRAILLPRPAARSWPPAGIVPHGGPVRVAWGRRQHARFRSAVPNTFAFGSGLPSK